MGFENIGLNGNNTANSTHVQRFFAGVGARIKVPITPTLAFVSGRTGAVHFGHFNNVGDNGTGLYLGATGYTEASSDFLLFSAGSNNSNTIMGTNLPAGLLLQPDPHLAITLQAGYSLAVSFPSSGGSTQALHFIPVGLEAVVTPAPLLDIGFRFFLDGMFAQSGTGGSAPGYFDLRALMLWFRVRA
jgi:hypothetical protein